ncbi:BTB/POZ domain-containing protein KCTD9-like [Actinia tenebrosa]|uniref:BTB/POZ domain-containing protein KCTD9-like n=1 Tax=Actinia tenebrosa TaxID=6105 RepID=A0A6P8HZD4_ACTTE|nr:BTB/POZ domain-containing protein KCTD9-like [Actinia tenebrosa]
MASNIPKRAVIYKHGILSEGKLVSVPKTMQELERLVKEKLQLSCVEGIYTSKGGRIDNIELIRDDEVLYIASEKPASNNIDFVPSLLHQQMSKADDLIPKSYSDWVTLNVGGQLFTTTRATLLSKSNSMLAKMFSVTDSWCSIRDPSGAYLIDRSPVYFEPILNYLRHGRVILDEGVNPRGVLEEAKFFGLTSMMEELEETVKKIEKLQDESLSRNEFVRILLSTPSTRELRCQGINLEGADLSNLDLRHINFKLANLSHSDLAGANLSHCSLENANLSYAHLDGAILGNTRFQRANLEGASLRGCNFEDPTGVQAHLEGVNLKASDLEGSQMTNVILRVATLKGANLQNCNLRGAILAGADLENCNLSGCDLQDANLRGANVVGAKFAEILGPLHMSQSVGAYLGRTTTSSPD